MGSGLTMGSHQADRLGVEPHHVQSPMPRADTYHPKHLERVFERVSSLRQEALALEREHAEELAKVASDFQQSARNLVHYLAVRRHDLRPLQRDLQALGLSSLGRLEGRVLAGLNAVLVALCHLRGQAVPEEFEQDLAMDLGETMLHAHTISILGRSRPHRQVRIMVTMPDEAASDPVFVERLLEEGMDVMRINCAHGDRAAWARMIEHKRRAEAALGRPCRVAFDLGGPKLRTGPMEPGPEVLKWRPRRDALGRTVVPVRVFFGLEADEQQDAAVFVPVGPTFAKMARVGDQIRFSDARERERTLEVVAVNSHGCTCEADRTSYLISGTPLTLCREDQTVAVDQVGRLPAIAQTIDLGVGDRLVLTDASIPGEPAVRDVKRPRPAHIGCTLPRVFLDARKGERVLFDDGKLAGVIRRVAAQQLEVEITHAVRGQVRLRAEKGINLPDTTLQLPALSETDLEHLEFIAQHGDMVSLSFVRRRQDVDDLIARLDQLGARHLGIVLKIENRQAFEVLPDLLLAALQHPPVAVMVARGDLGVEVGFERLAEVQEEILWLCEAAHIPVIWATQVLETLAKEGLPTRAEVTDAAMAARAECVMLNKGPYIEAAITFLDDVLRRMQDHQTKKTAMLRRLKVSGQQPTTPTGH